jgi:hypothetical protein
MTESGTFPEGIIVDGKVCREFTLDEELFRHTLELSNDPAIDPAQFNDPAYYSACLLAKRLTVPGIDRVTPELVQNLSGADGAALVTVATKLEIRRKAFRDAAEAAPEAGTGAT